MAVRRRARQLCTLLGLVGALALTGPACAPGRPASAPVGGGEASTAPAAEYFAGKTLTVLVNFSAGGPTDTFARLVAQYLPRHLPGRPALVVENLAGAGGVIAAKHLYHAAPRDGLTLGAFSSLLTAQLVQGASAKYDATGFLWLGGSNETAVSYAHQSLGVRSWRDLRRPAQEIVVGGLSPESAKDLAMRTFLDLIGAKYRYVTGYPGVSEIALAFRRGEVTFAEDNLPIWMSTVAPLVREGIAVPVGQRGILRAGQLVRDLRVGDVPTYLEAVVQLQGEAARQRVEYRALALLVEAGSLFRAVVYPPSTDPALVALMRQAVADTFADTEFQAAAEKQLGYPLELVPGAEAQAVAERVIGGATADPEAVDYLQRQAGERS
jgi:tripartite-type tricarboxylate transporter receptor subunit TctC